MSYDRFGRTPEMARRDRFHDWLCVAALGLILAAIVTAAVLVVVVVGA
jgi:hypothetical protein